MNHLEQYLNRIFSYSNKLLTPTQLKETVEVAARKDNLTAEDVQRSIKNSAPAVGHKTQNTAADACFDVG